MNGSARCCWCEEDVPVGSFAIDRSRALGRKSICKPCDREKSRWYYEQNREKKLAKMKARKAAKAASMPPRPCKRCGAEVVTGRRWYCDPCQRCKARARGPKVKNPGGPKYGRPHQRVRDKHARVVAAGLAVCARCGRAIEPDEAWDLGHVDGDPTAYAGPEHRRCNRATSTHRKQRLSGIRHSRRW